MTSAENTDQLTTSFTFQIEPDQVLEEKIFVRLPAAAATGPAKDFNFDVAASDGSIHVTAAAKFETPNETSK